MKNKITLKTQLIILFVSVIAGAIAFISFYTGNSTLNTITRNNETVRLNSFNRVQAAVDLFADDITKTMHMLLLHAPISDFIKGDCIMDANGVLLRREIGIYLDRIMSLNSGINSILIRTWDGAIIGAENHVNYNYNLASGKKADLDYIFDSVDTTLKWSLIPAYSNRVGNKGKSSVYLTQAFYWSGKRTEIAIALQHEGLYNLYAPFSESNLSDIYLCTENGEIVSAQSPNSIQSKVAFSDRFNLDDGHGSFLYQFPDKRKSQIIYQTVSGPDWLVVEEVPIVQYTRDSDKLRTSFLLIAVIVIAVAIVMATFFIRRLMRPFYSLAAAMDKMRLGEVGVQISENFYNEFGEIAGQFNVMSSELKLMMAANREIEQQKSKYAIAALKAQINPHFMFNTINTIKWMAIGQQAGNIAESLELLTALIKPLFKESASEISLSDELDYLENYIKLLNLRFGGVITFKSELSFESPNHNVPRFILQPIVENSVQHGQLGINGKGIIFLRAWEKQDSLLIEISDNGCGIKPEDLLTLQCQLDSANGIVENGDSIGLANVYQRLKLAYGEKGELHVTSNDDGGLTVIIKLPKM